MISGFSRAQYAQPSAEGDINDCMVRAYAVTKNIPLVEARALFAAHGRRPGHGTSWAIAVAVLGTPSLPPRVTTLQLLMTLGYFRTGRYIVITSSHAMAVVDGVIHNWLPAKKSRIVKFWRIK
jgi:hypothetical protein